MAKIIVNPELCKACGLCIAACKKEVIIYGTDVNSKGYHAVTPDEGKECVGCCMCAVICPEAAIEVYK